MLFISTLASSINYLVAGSLPLLYGVAYGGINLVAAPAGEFSTISSTSV